MHFSDHVRRAYFVATYGFRPLLILWVAIDDVNNNFELTFPNIQAFPQSLGDVSAQSQNSVALSIPLELRPAQSLFSRQDGGRNVDPVFLPAEAIYILQLVFVSPAPING